MVSFFDLLNTIIQVFIVTYFPYYFLTNSKEIDCNKGKKKLVASSIILFIITILITYSYNNSNISSVIITISNIIIIWAIYNDIYKKALVAYSLSYIFVQFTSILVTSIVWPLLNGINSNVDKIVGIYIPAIILELIIIKNIDAIKMLYNYSTKNKLALELNFIIIIFMDFLIAISMINNNWSNVYSVNIVIIFFIIFIILVSVYFDFLEKKYTEINMLNKLLLEKNNELKKIKHDYGSQISYINGLYIMKQYDRLGDMLNNIINGNKSILSNVQYVNNRGSIISTIVESIDLKDIHILVDEEFNSDLIDITPHDFHKILSNILNNAVYSLKGNGLIIIKTYKVFNTVYISVKNNGPRIDPSVIEKIFDEGFTTKENLAENNGYGLSIVKEITEKNNGKLSVYSDELHTEFKFMFFNNDNNI